MALRTLVVYVVLLVGIRLSGKREIGQFTPFDLVVLLLLSNAVQNAMTGPDTSVVGGIVAAAVLIIVNLAVAAGRGRFAPFRRWVEGVPVVLVSHGEIQWPSLAHERMTSDELLATLREHEVSDVGQVEMAMLEIDGSVSVIRRAEKAGPDGFRHSRRRFVRRHRAHD
ncbi:MAG: DUF421 domain-containing protein [Fimbriimonas ginsengisoli]|uniref:DUF421 domain-containing protein n=1 Tax=Fimbriimonas ginsengisoli TaxID=1005039 RepID=A0A931PUI8_FIMGI|nr:DUF421 domain-containing protein [Fimbriimonas ginsengisoli]